jgi:glycosyltransferase involved in cell wall biosynthesis
MKVAVIMPAFNEARTLDAILERVLAQPCVAEVVAVDDGSTDGSWEILQQWATARSAGVPPASAPGLRPGSALSGVGAPACVPSAGRPPEPAAGDGCATRIVALRHERNQGKGAAIHTALAHVQSEWVLIQDADLEYDPADYAALLEPIRSGRADVVYGSRFAAHQNADATWHTWGNRLLTWASNRVTGLRLTDEATCYKLLPDISWLRQMRERKVLVFKPTI